MSITAVALRRQGRTWAEIADRLQFESPAAARASAVAALAATSKRRRDER